MARLDPRESYDVLKDRVTEAISSNFPQEGSKHILELNKVHINDDLDINDISKQKEAKMSGTTFGIPVKAEMTLKDKTTGEVIEKKTLKVATLPKYTRRHSFIVKGSEYQVDNQWRLKPGIYTRIAQNGELQSRFNFQGKQSLDMTFDPKTKMFRMKHGGSKPPLYPILKAVGVDDNSLERAWGKEILQANKTTATGKAINTDKLAINFAKRLDPRADVKDMDTASDVIRNYMEDTKLRKDVTKLTLGKGYDKITPDALTRSSKRLLGVSRGDEKPDVRDALMFKDLLGVEDFIAERMGEGTKAIKRKISNNLDKKETLRQIVAPDIFDRPIREFFSKSSLASTPEQTNPLQMLSGQQRTTITGEGGVKDAHKIMEDAKLVDPSHFGILDPLHTPESEKTGVTLHLSTSAVKKGKSVLLPLVNVKTGKTEFLDPRKVNDSIVAMPDEGRWDGKQWKPKASIVKASVPGNEVREVNSKDVKYVMKNTGQMFSVATNMVPFLNSDSPNRSTMAGRHMEQAIPLKNSEAPLVQSDRGDGRSYDEFVGQYASHETDISGTVSKIEPGAIHIKGANGKVKPIQIYDNYPLTDKKGILTSKPVVRVGETVKKGQLIADSNFTKDGVYAPGTNMRVGYTPWKGYNFEDGVVISDTAAKKLTSEHLHKKSLLKTEAEPVSLSKYLANKSTTLTKEQMGKLDNDGIVRKGMKVKKGDTLIAALVEKPPTTESQMLKNLHRSLVNPYSDRSVTWDQDVDGEVVDISKKGKSIQVHIKTDESMQVGDKLVGRHGNKGIVTRILPDHEMPQTEDGKPLEVVMNPIGIADRMNVGQVLETAAGKLARKKGEFYKVQNFGHEDNRTKVEQDLKKAGIKDKETILDPVNNVKVPGVLVGDQYILKLQHQVDKKMMARSRDGYDRNLTPKGGGHHGAQALGSLGVYAMLAHGAKCLMGSTVLRPRNGKRLEISDIVRNRREIEVLSADPETKVLSYKPIVAWSVRVADPEELCCVTVAAANPSGRKHIYKLKGTINHTIYTDRGKIQAGDLEIGDWLYTPGTTLHPVQRQMIIGSVLGDGNLAKSETFASSYRITHGIDQRDYCEWKRQICSGLLRTNKLSIDRSNGYSDKPKVRFWTRSIGELSELRKIFYPDGKKIIPQEILDELDDIGLAFWFMDDGNTDIQSDRLQKYRTVRLAVCDFDDESVERAQSWFMDRWGLHSTVQKKSGKYSYLHFFNEHAIEFLKIVSPYIHESMRYKLKLDVDSHKFTGVDLSVVGRECSSLLVHSIDGLEKVAVLSVDPYEPKPHEDYLVYNVEVEGNHNYIADGVLVGNSNLREMQTMKSDKAQNDEVWAALQAGEPIPPPQTTFAYKKFEGYLKGMGVNVEKTGNSLNLMPLTDKQVEDMSNGELKDAGRTIKAYREGSKETGHIDPEKSGLFDPKITGGLDGVKWSHISLKDPIPNPVFEKAVKGVTGIRGPQFDRLIRGEEGVDKDGNIVSVGTKGATFGPQSVGTLLDKVDVQGELKELESKIGGMKEGQKLNETRRKLKFLKALDKLSMTPREAYMMQKVPVMPPAMRPLAATANGSLQFDDLNQLYKDVALLDQQLREQPKYAPDSIKAEPRADIYDRMKGLTGMGGSLKDRYKGIANIISGDSPKLGYVQDKLIKRKQDLTMRSTIVPEPSLGLDDIAIPRKAATELYKPFVVREMRMSTGMGPLSAKKLIDENPTDPAVKMALDRVVDERPLLVKRDPALHKYNIQAFKPKLVEGKAIKIHPLVCSGYNADFDGDTMSAYVPMTNEAVDEARKMMPSRILFNPATARVMYTPSHEAQVGLFMKSEVGKKTRMKFKDEKELREAIKKGRLASNDVATIGDVRTTLDRMEVDKNLPEKLRGGKVLTDMDYRFTKSEQNKMFESMANADKNGYAKNIDKMKDLGNLKATHGGFSFGLEDFKTHKDIRDPILNTASKNAAKLNLDKDKDMEKFVEIYEGAMNDMRSQLKSRASGGKNPLDKLEVAAGIKGKGYAQLTGAPGLFVDAKGEVVPSPVTRNYSEGLSASDYWASSSGGRKGVIQKVQSVAEPGYLTKLMMNSTLNTLVSKEDCGTEKGISLDIDEPDIVGRYTTSDIKVGKTTIAENTMLTPEVVNKMRNGKVSRVLVRSPMRCTHAKGVCKKCMGLNENGQLHDLGTNIGVLSAQAIGERGTQLAMKAFHSGGVFEGRTSQEKSVSGGGLDRAMSILHMPKKVKGSAKLAETNGTVTAIDKDPAGGYNLKVGESSHYIPAGRKLLTKVSKGSTIKKGDPLTSGPINPHELLPLTNMNKVQGYLASELHSIYAPEGIRRRNSEVVVRALSDVTKVEDPGDNSDLIVGDFAPTTVINDWNKKNRKAGKIPVRHTPVLKGVKQIPLDVQTDWLARLNHENLRGTIVDAAQQGWASQLHGEHPIPPLIYGAEFGKGTKDKPWSY